MILSSREIVDAVLGASPDHKKPPSLSGFEKVCGADNYRDRKRRCEQRFITEGSVSVHHEQALWKESDYTPVHESVK